MTAVTSSAAVSFVAAVLGLAVLLGAVIAVLFSQLRRNTTALVREENEDLRKRLDTVIVAEKECSVRLAKQEATTKILSDLVTGTTAVKELSMIVTANHEAIVTRLDKMGKRAPLMERPTPKPKGTG